MPHRKTIQEFLNPYLTKYDMKIEKQNDNEMQIIFNTNEDLTKFHVEAESEKWIFTIINKHNKISCYLKK